MLQLTDQFTNYLKNKLADLRRVLNVKVVLSGLVTVFVFVAIFATSRFAQQKQTLSTQAAGYNVNLNMTASKTNLLPGDTFLVNVYLTNTVNHYHISATDFTVLYPNTILTLNSIKPGSFFYKNYVVSQTEMMALGITCSVPSDCPFSIIENGQNVSAKCVNSLCSGSSTSLSAPGRARIVLGAPCAVNGSTCYTQTGSDLLATLQFTVPPSAPLKNITVSFDKATAVVTATEYSTAGSTPVNLIDSSQLNSLSLQISSPSSNLDVTPPVVTITSPPNNTQLPSSGLVGIIATASDAGGIAWIKIYGDQILLKTCDLASSCSYFRTAGSISSGQHNITVAARDKASNLATTTIIVNK